MNDSTQAQDNTQNTPTRSEQEQQLLTQFQKLNKPTQQVLLTFMKAAADKDVALMRTCQQTLPEEQRHLFDEAIAKAEQAQGVKS